MNVDEIFQVGQWLVFKKGTCFGPTKDHVAIIVGIDTETQSIGIAVNASSKIAEIKKFAERNQINLGTTIVRVSPNDYKASCHIGEETAFDCNRPSIISYKDIERWYASGLVNLADYNVDVNRDLLNELRLGIWESPMVEQKFKNML